MYRAILVDDEPRILKGLMEIVKWEDYGIEIAGQASNGQDALRMIEQGGISILITDIHMPEMDGLALIRQLRHRKSTIKIIVLSGYDDFNYVKEASKLGIENYLLKPVVQDELASTLFEINHKIEQELNLQSELRSSAMILRNNILNRWMTGAISRINLTERAELLQIDLMSPFYVVCLFKILFEDQHDYTFRELTNYAFENICNELLSATHSGVITLTDANGYVAVLFHGQHEECDEVVLHGLVARCIAACGKFLKCSVFATIGSRETDYYEVSKSYSNANQLMEYRMIMPADSIASYEQVEQRPMMNDISIHIDFDSFQSSVALQDENKAIAWLEEAFQIIGQTEGITPQNVQTICVEILYRILSALNQIKMNASMLLGDKEDGLTPLVKAKNLNEMKDWLKSIVLKAFYIIRHEEDGLNPITKRVLAYLEKHYKDNISLKTIAAAFNVNAAYLGQLIINDRKDTFSNLLNMRRIEESKKLLSSTSLSLQEVAENVGYVNQTYFNTLFKKIVGVYPTKYRLENAESSK
ncbi:response regulator [Cohnella sp. GbtcB17]|uniref:response regulator n=1 Tax=Cohnella sp. GbtcB17 TaxID=2824762 RepID=UPI001C2FD841|nr:response regulator [Cohnella sp. GbtcB17]